MEALGMFITDLAGVIEKQMLVVTQWHHESAALQ
jgi:hypothetical protein